MISSGFLMAFVLFCQSEFLRAGVTDQDWGLLRDSVQKNRERLVADPNFVLRVDVVAQEVKLANKWTLPIVDSSFTVAIRGDLYRYSSVDQKLAHGLSGHQV